MLQNNASYKIPISVNLLEHLTEFLNSVINRGPRGWTECNIPQLAHDTTVKGQPEAYLANVSRMGDHLFSVRRCVHTGPARSQGCYEKSIYLG